MAFPQTPLTLLGRLKNRGMPRLWESSWEEFFDLYHEAIGVCVRAAFRRYGWESVSMQDHQDVVLRVFESLFRGKDAYDPDKGRFRQFVTTVCQRRVVDFIRHHSRKSGRLKAFDAESMEFLSSEASLAGHTAEEETAFRRALLGTLLAALHEEVPPRTFLIFERVKLMGEPADEVAAELKVSRSVIDNTIYKAMTKLREISRRPEIQQEL